MYSKPHLRIILGILKYGTFPAARTNALGARCYENSKKEYKPPLAAQTFKSTEVLLAKLLRSFLGSDFSQNQSLKIILNFELIILSEFKGVSSVERLNNYGVG
jgi:hypothetical protein